MQPYTFVGIVLLVGAAVLHSGPDQETQAEKIARLIKQLGHDKFAMREAASKALLAIGEPAVEALRKATVSGDAEVCTRATQILAIFHTRGCESELAKWTGSWEAAGGVWMKVNADRWSSGTPTWGPVSGTIRVIELRPKYALAVMSVHEGPSKGQICRAIFRLEGDTLHYCGTYGPEYPIEFKNGGNFYFVVFKRVKQ